MDSVPLSSSRVCSAFVTVRSVRFVPASASAHRACSRGCARLVARTVLAVLGLMTCAACGDHGVLPTTVDPGADFQIADVVYDANYYYCKVEPMLFAQHCGPGDGSKGDPSGGCHFNVTSFRLTNYSPLVGSTCNGLVPAVRPPPAAQNNYEAAQAQMNRNPDQAPLLNRPSGTIAHPRVIFSKNSPQANIIRQWATRYSSQ